MAKNNKKSRIIFGSHFQLEVGDLGKFIQQSARLECHDESGISE